MFIPIGDQPNPRGTPFVTYALIVLNIAIFVFVSLPLMSTAADLSNPSLSEYVSLVKRDLPSGVNIEQLGISSYDLLVLDYGYRPAMPSVVSLFTSMFLHGGLMHLLGNMLFLWIYGDNVEHRLGSVAFLGWYLVSGVAATLFHALFAADSPVPLVGASGAISGVLGCYFVWFPHNKVRVLMFLFYFVRVIMLPARWVLGFYLVVSNILPFLAASGSGGGVAHGAHIGGFLAGVGIAFIRDRREIMSPPKEYRGKTEKVTGLNSKQTAMSQAFQEGDFGEASRLYFNLSPTQTKQLLKPDESLELGDWLARNGHSRAALTVYQRHLRDYPLGPRAAESHVAAGLLQLHVFRESTAAYQHFMDALDCKPSKELKVNIRNALLEIEELQKFPVRNS